MTLAVPTPTVVLRDAAVKDELARLGDGHGFGQQLVQVQHLHAAFLHLQDEVVMVLLGLVHPDDIVEQQILAVARGQALVGKARAADHDGAELANF